MSSKQGGSGTTKQRHNQPTSYLEGLAQEAVQHLRHLHINLVALDFDRTVIDIHTGSVWQGSVKELADRVRPEIVALVQAIEQSNRIEPSMIHLAVVTFSKQIELIRGVIATFCNASSEIPLPIRGNDKSWKEPSPSLGWWPCNAHVNYDAAKQPHLLSAAQEIHASSGDTSVFIKKTSTLLIDDDAFNVQVAKDNGVRAIRLIPKHPSKLFDDVLSLTE